MSNQAHLEQLREKHASLEQAIAQEIVRPQPDSTRLTDLKRQKLRLKEEIVRIQPS